jgi:hypothetical protein
VGAISHYFGAALTTKRAERSGECCRADDAAFDGDEVVGGAGAFPSS